MNTPMIQVRDIRKVYGVREAAVNALDGLDLDIRPGEFVAIMGPSGSGKSTLMNIIGCLDRPTSGKYILNNQDVSKLDKNKLAVIRNQHLGFIFQSFNLLPRLSALDNVIMPMVYQHDHDDSKEAQKKRAEDMLRSVGLGDRMHHKPSELSGGQQQRVAIARALINQPSVILADEPTGNLDSHSSLEILDLLYELYNRAVTIVMVTHDPNVASHAERIIFMIDGKIKSDGNGKDGSYADNKVVNDKGIL
jgi:putative ABC transport system ATP-binding protein